MISLLKSHYRNPPSANPGLRYARTKYSRIVSVLLLSFVMSACAIKTRDELQGEDAKPQEDISNEGTSDLQEYSLKEDRSQFDKLRGQIPQEVQKKNDELSLVLGLMKGFEKSPSKIRSRFDKVMRKKRDAFNRDLKRERNDFNRDERKKRDQFLRKIKDQRRDFDKKKSDRETRNRFNQDYREMRDRFFNDQREKRLETESEWRQRRRDFEAYVREKRGDFSEELRSYSKRYYQYKKNSRLKKKMERKSKYLERKARNKNRMLDSGGVGRGKNDDSADFRGIYSKPATPLQTDGE